MKKKLVLLISLLLLLSSCTTVQDPKLADIIIPTLSDVRPVKPMLIASPVTVSDILSNYNTVVGYSVKQDIYIDSLEKYNKDIEKILTDADI